jgi:hypothetical protein
MQRFTSAHSGWKRKVMVVCALTLLPAIMVPAFGQSSGKGKRLKGSKGKQRIPTPSASATEGEQSLTNIPLPIGHEAKGLVLPDFDAEGRLKGKFIAGAARRLDQNHIGFTDLKITTYKEDNQVDMEIDMRNSTLDLTTRLLSSPERTTVRRADFDVVGDSAVFDTNARTSRIMGNVKMVITNQPNTPEQQP